MVEEELPAFLREVCDALVEAGVFPEDRPPNHVLLNEYTDGQGIGPHKDGPLYDARVAILSLGKEASLEFWASLEDAEADCAAASTVESDERELADMDSASDARRKRRRRDGETGTGTVKKRSLASVKCEHCSLIVFEGRAYNDVWHGIPASLASREDEQGPESRNRRLSFTVRRVARVISADSVVEHPEARSEMERRRLAFESSVSETGVPAWAVPGPRGPLS
ncbi:unnamed protein product [Ascophyllum nodosum]